MEPDPLLIGTIFLLLMTVGVAVLYYRRIKRVQEEYEDAKGVVDDIILSFNKQLERQEDKLDAVAHKMRALSSANEGIVEKIGARDRQLATLDARIEGVSGVERRVLERFEKVDKKIEEVDKMQEGMVQKIADLEQKVPVVPRAEIEAVIPIRKERALAPLTETELGVLETLATEGEKTAPEIRERIELSREHTSRLMKKLYENGYLERDTRKIPYIYRLKKEMLRILKKIEV